MKIKTSKLIGPTLDYAVAVCEGGVYQPPSSRESFWIWPTTPVRYSKEAPKYSTDWAQGGPIVEREQISIAQYGGAWKASSLRQSALVGPTPLIAAMRAYVASKLGAAVDVPEELLEN